MNHQRRLNRLGTELSATAQLLNQHVLTSEKLTLVQNALTCLSWQTRWSSSGPLARFLISYQSAALLGTTLATSSTGFIGPEMERYNQVSYHLMKSYLDPDAMGLMDLLAITTQLLTIGVIYTSTQLLGFQKEMFPRHDPGAAKKGALLFRDLGLRFLFGSDIVKTTLAMLAKELGIEDRHQKIIGEIGHLHLLILLYMLHDEDSELLETLSSFMLSSIEAMEQALDKVSMEEDKRLIAASQLHVFHQALKKRENKAITQVIEEGLEAFQLSYKALKEEGKQLSRFCNQLNLSFDHIFNQVESATTTMTQSA
jgi:hypothetical protein